MAAGRNIKGITIISIHTPTRGVTAKAGTPVHIDLISIHTPTRGVTGTQYITDNADYHFNPHSHKGSDTCPLYDCSDTGYFNPHSHKGSDHLSQSHNRQQAKDFNPHSHKGSDCFKVSVTCAFIISIHTPTRGVTLTTL